MSIGYSLRIRDLNANADAANIGVRLGAVCIQQGVSVTDIAKRIGVTRATVYNWFCGVTSPHNALVPEIEALIASIE